MDKTINVGLSGHDQQFRLSQGAYDRLARYLDRAEARLQADPDRAEVLRDLERSIGDRLAASSEPADRVVAAAEIEAILDDVGTVGTDTDTDDSDRAREPGAAPTRPRRRRLMRVREGQAIAGVCTGLAAYSEIRVDWVRTIFVLAAIFTAGFFVIVYIAMAFILPVAETQEA